MSHTYKYPFPGRPAETICVIVNGDWSGMAIVRHLVPSRAGGEYVNATWEIPGEVLLGIAHGHLATIREDVEVLAESVGIKVSK
jgi:hypothetical protein